MIDPTNPPHAMTMEAWKRLLQQAQQNKEKQA